MVALSLYSMGRFATLINYSDIVDKTSSVIINIRSAEVFIRDIALTERGYIITRDTTYLSRFNNSIDSTYKCIESIKTMVHDNPEQQKNIALLKGTIALRIAAARANMAYADTSYLSAGLKYYDDSRQLMKECSQRLREMRNVETSLLAIRFKNEQAYQQLTNDTLKYLLIIFCVITLVLFAIMIKELRSRMIFQEELQAKVIDLKRSHNELQEIAYVASHDLQEPLRKIQVFSNMLLTRRAGSIDDPSKETLGRINTAASQMQLLITDLMNLTNLTKNDEHKIPVDLNKTLQFILAEAEDQINEKGALLEIQPLPVVDAFPSQVSILFKALLDNSLKFTRKGVKPVITISCDIMTGQELEDVNSNLLNKKFYRITCSDNGIGFEKKFINKIFMIFQQLHTPEDGYEGKGIGLAICRRIMANHEGYIIAYGEPGLGAKFTLFFPMEG